MVVEETFDDGGERRRRFGERDRGLDGVLVDFFRSESGPDFVFGGFLEPDPGGFFAENQVGRLSLVDSVDVQPGGRGVLDENYRVAGLDPWLFPIFGGKFPNPEGHRKPGEPVQRDSHSVAEAGGVQPGLVW